MGRLRDARVRFRYETLPKWRRGAGQRCGLYWHLLTRPSSWRWYGDWRRSLQPGHAPIDDAYPLITFGARKWLDDNLTDAMRVFEYGSGGSTFYFLPRVAEVVSVEHDAGWFGVMQKKLDDHGATTCQYLLREPRARDEDDPPYTIDSFTSSFPAFGRMDYGDYVRAIDAYDDASFDLVVVDGRARISCIKRAMPKVQPGGYLMLDNAERTQYRPGRDLLSDWSCTDFRGLGPNCPFVWMTSVWQRPG